MSILASVRDVRRALQVEGRSPELHTPLMPVEMADRAAREAGLQVQHEPGQTGAIYGIQFKVVAVA